MNAIEYIIVLFFVGFGLILLFGDNNGKGGDD